MLLVVSACTYGPPTFQTHQVSYEQCGRKICVHGSRSRPSMNPNQLPMGAATVSRDVLVPLNQLRTSDFRELDDGWATDGKKVWCGRPDPEGTIDDLRRLGEHYYAMGTTFRFGCAAIEDQYGKPWVIHSFELLGCRIARINGNLASLDEEQTRFLDGIVDVESFVIDDPVACRAHDRLRQYRIVKGWPQP